MSLWMQKVIKLPAFAFLNGQAMTSFKLQAHSRGGLQASRATASATYLVNFGIPAEAGAVPVPASKELAQEPRPRLPPVMPALACSDGVS